MSPTGNPIFAPIGSLFMGTAVGVLVYSLRDVGRGWLGYIEADLADKLRRLRAPTQQLHTYLVSWLSFTGVVLLIFWLALDNLIFGVLFAAFLLCGPWYWLRRMAEQRREKIENQLADAMVMLANSVRAGLSLPQSMDVLAGQCPAPINAEFRQITGEYNMGKPLEQTLQSARDRLRSENFALFAAAMMASHESGGKLNEVVERIAASVLELQRLERKVLSETAQARRSALYMGIAPLFILVVYYFVEPDNTMRLFREPAGQIVLSIVFVFNVIAYLWARLILNPDI